jgi:hypothetical protein
LVASRPIYNVRKAAAPDISDFTYNLAGINTSQEQMTDSRIDAPVLVVTVIAAGAPFLFSPLTFGWLTTAGGFTLLVILFAYDRQKQRPVSQSVAFSSVCGLAFTLAAGIVLQRLTNRADLTMWLPATWLGATVLGVIIDRYRAGGHVASTPGLHLSAAGSTPYVGFSTTAMAVQNSAPASPPARPAVPEESAPVGVAEEAPAASSAPPQPQQPPQPQPVSVRRPEEATIYVDVVGGGIAFLRSVRAEHVARDIYRIVDIMPADEQWRYQPGQTVRCKKRKLSSGKALVAYQEIVLQRVS